MSIQINGTSGISGVDGSATTPALQGTDTNTGISFGTDTVNVVTGGTTRATVDANGDFSVNTDAIFVDASADRVGIGTTSPGAPLDIQSNSGAEAVYIRAHSSPEIGQMHFRNNANSASFFRISAESGSTELNAIGSSNLSFVTNSSERMRIDSDGYLKASRDGTYFSVNENNHSFENSWNGNLIARLYHGGTDGNQYGLEITTGHDQNNATNHFFQCVGGSTVRARFTSNGGLRNYQANDVNLCDEREKKNIVDLDSTWDCLKHWDLKKFHYNDQDDTEDKKYGVIAQQIAPHCPEVIDNWVKQEAKEAVLDDDGNVVTPAVEEITRMGVKEQQMYWMAIKALQEAQTRIEQLETRVAQLEGGTN